MKIFVMRHGEAEFHADSDKSRQLTVRGRLQVEAKAKSIRRLLSEVDIILHSSYTRAKQTAEIMADTLELKDVEELKHWTPESDPRNAISSLEGFVDRTPLIVTHMPLISYVEALLCDGNMANPAGFNCAEVVQIEAEWPAIGLGFNAIRF